MADIPTCASLADISPSDVEVTMMDHTSKGLTFRVNERVGKQTKASMKIAGKTYQIDVPPFGIAEKE